LYSVQQGQTWGRAVVDNLAKDLRTEFPGISGFSSPNLYRMRQFYEVYRGDEFLSPLVREISWTKNLAILERCKESAEREFLHPQYETIRLDQERPHPPNREPDLPEDASESDQFRHGASRDDPRTGEAGRER
jgi:hypothetical protein